MTGTATPVPMIPQTISFGIGEQLHRDDYELQIIQPCFAADSAVLRLLPEWIRHVYLTELKHWERIAHMVSDGLEMPLGMKVLAGRYFEYGFFRNTFRGWLRARVASYDYTEAIDWDLEHLQMDVTIEMTEGTNSSWHAKYIMRARIGNSNTPKYSVKINFAK